MKRLIKIVAVAAAVLAGASAFAKPKFRDAEQIKKSKVLKVAVFSDKKPFGYVDEYGKYQGYDVYFAERIAKTADSRKNATVALPRTVILSGEDVLPPNVIKAAGKPAFASL